MRDRFDVTGRRALVTGASLGMGRAIAIGLAEHGADVVIHHAAGVDRRLGAPDAAGELVDVMTGLGREAWLLEADLGEPGAGREVIAGATGLAGRIDILVICASTQFNVDFLDTTDEQLDSQVAVNFKASYEMLQCALPAMRARGWGRVLTIGSINQHDPRPELATYAALKSAQFNLVRNLAAQYAPHGVTLNNLSPGLVRTPRNDWRRENLAEWESLARSCSPMQRAGEPDDVVGAAVLLCSDAASYITGSDLTIAGGMQLFWQPVA